MLLGNPKFSVVEREEHGRPSCGPGRCAPLRVRSGRRRSHRRRRPRRGYYRLTLAGNLGGAARLAACRALLLSASRGCRAPRSGCCGPSEPAGVSAYPRLGLPCAQQTPGHALPTAPAQIRRTPGPRKWENLSSSLILLWRHH